MKVCDFRLGPAVARGIVTVADTTVDSGDLLTVSGRNTVLGFSVSGVNVTRVEDVPALSALHVRASRVC